VYLVTTGVISFLGSLPQFFTPGAIPGRDSQSHIAKTAFLMYSFSHWNFTGWSEFWYSGFQLFYTYSPLAYVLAALFGAPFDSALIGMKILVSFSFILSGMGGYFLSRDFKISANWSVMAGSLYALAPPHLLSIFDYGSLSYSLGFALAPFLFLSLRYALRKLTFVSVVYLGIIGALYVISNDVSLYVFLYPFIAYILISTPWKMALKTARVILEAFALAFLLSAFWLIPYLYYEIFGGLDLINIAGSGYSSCCLIYWYSLIRPNFGSFPAGFLSWVLFFPALLAIIFIIQKKKEGKTIREEVALYVAALIAVFLTIGSTLTPLFYKIPIVLALEFPARFLIGDVLFLSPLAALFFYRLFQSISKTGSHLVLFKSGAFALIFLLAIIPIAEPSTQKLGLNTWHVSDPNQISADNFLSKQSGFFRVIAIDQFYEAFPQFTMKGSLGGWYYEAEPAVYSNYLFDVYSCGAGSAVMQGLRLMGVRYVMIEPGFGGDGSSAIKSFQNLSSSVFGTPVFENNAIFIYEVPDSQLVYVSRSPPLPLAKSLSGLKQIGSCGTPIPAPPPNLINDSVSNLRWGETDISFDVYVNASAYVTIASAYSQGWLVKDNGSAIPFLLTSPGIPVINISSGLNHIELYYTGAPYSQLTAILSFVTLLAIPVAILITSPHNRQHQTR
jgi:uncharacterized membrane protein